MDLTAAVAGVGLESPSLATRGELGWRPAEGMNLFAFTQADMPFNQPLSYEAGLGFKYEW